MFLLKKMANTTMDGLSGSVRAGDGAAFSPPMAKM